MSERTSKYWICDACAEKNGWVTAYPNGGNTLMSGLCGHCERDDETFLTPVSDFKKHPKDKVWD